MAKSPVVPALLKVFANLRPMQGVDMKIMNPNEYGIGEVVVKSDNVMAGYYKDVEMTILYFGLSILTSKPSRVRGTSK